MLKRLINVLKRSVNKPKSVDLVETDAIESGRRFINIGCGDVAVPGFYGSDVRKTTQTHFVCSAWELNKEFQNNTVDGIYTRHMVEHLDPNDARKAFACFHDILAVDAMVNIVVPNLEFHCKQFLGLAKSPVFSEGSGQRQHAFAGFFGWRDEQRGGSREDAHRWGYDEDLLFDELRKVGFTEIIRATSVEEIPDVFPQADFEPWHLNIVARKK